ncbi:uncharacterized protein LOC116598247 isoform X1 [Mustela erminea]|uniref:uncharacterized protein LOC116598247 isoform X1 n=1 Tax=Mustela erminea TaxID=36723 RepID=UPI00138701E0|nr:uncharacterized protein LOC116598247 isoform X1 [Mustela erminea]XP_032212660.1 uncharacterized protein LOC116598247 isoform X1 [Mustela erminea]XP_032212661.1 uncharacterized protein LOC116598247 isoform X1 [Mustela erminea]
MSLPGTPQGPPSAPLSQSRVSLVAQFRHEPKLHHVREPETREDLSQGLLLSVPTPTLGIFSFWISESSIRSVENYKPRLCQGSRDFSPGNSYGVRRACFFGSHNLTQVSLKDGDEAHSSRYLKFRYGRLKYLVEVQSLSQISANSEETYNLLLNMSSSFFCFH